MPMDSLQDLQRKWDSASRWYDLATVALEAVVFRRLRSRLLKSAYRALHSVIRVGRAARFSTCSKDQLLMWRTYVDETPAWS